MNMKKVFAVALAMTCLLYTSRFHLGGIKIVRLIGKADRSQAKHHRNARCRKGCPLWHTPEIRNPPDARFDIPLSLIHI